MTTQHLLTSYNLINTKLKKKRLLSAVRKPNLSPTVDQFVSIENAFKREGDQRYAAFCCIAIARCEQAMRGDSSSVEAAAYLEAAYLLADEQVSSSIAMQYKGFEEDISEAVNCYLLAVEIYLKHQRVALAASLYYEMGSLLMQLNKLEQASMFLQQSSTLYQPESPLNATKALSLSSKCKLLLRDYRGAVDCLLNLIKIVTESENNLTENLAWDSGSSATSTTTSGTSSSTHQLSIAYFPVSFPLRLHQLVEARITLILLLTLQDGFLQAKDQIGKLVEDVSQIGGGVCVGSEVSDELITLLQNLVMVCERREAGGLRALQRELWNSLTDSQNEILQLIAAANKIII
eukprot:TRINITY_DN1145_c0_g3_i1.p1 TRINITY_DN1145_c0_g3~~TRINITY_DN1145_c0_g3_i1.p1  ORF type:complete len:348 (+),score=56.74 TRINITY_DN1145_c0_g3_i1:217-1260(+)